MFNTVQRGSGGGSIPSTLPPSGPAGGSLSGTYPNPGLGNNVVSNSNLGQMANYTIKGRYTAGTGNPEDLTAAQVSTILGLNVAALQMRSFIGF